MQQKGTYRPLLPTTRIPRSRSCHFKHARCYGSNSRTRKCGTKSTSPYRHPPCRNSQSEGLLCRRIVRQQGFSQCLNLAAWARALRLSVYNSRYRSMQIPVLFESAHAMAEREVLVDLGATNNFISKNLLHRLKIGYLPVETPIKIWNVDGTHNQDGAISHFTDLKYARERRQEPSDSS